MGDRDPENRLLAMPANEGGLPQQVDVVERELRLVHAKLDQILCSVEALTSWPSGDDAAATTLREAVEPAAEAIHSGAGLLLERIRGWRSVSGW
jgi:hypothetical protein